MAKLNSIVRFLNKELNIKKIEDSSKNGLQVKGKPEVKKIAFSVDACIDVFEKAKKQKADMIIVHHGLLWKGQKDETGLRKKRIEWLKKNKISLYASHLPLDLHDKYGNNIKLAEILDLKDIKRFGKYHGKSIGYQGKTDTTINSIVNQLDRSLKTKCRKLSFGKNKIKTVGIVSGGGASALSEAVKKKLDCFIVGEAPHSTFHMVKDEKISLIIAGHYATETVGVKALMQLIKEKFEVNTTFIDNPTNM